MIKKLLILLPTIFLSFQIQAASDASPFTFSDAEGRKGLRVNFNIPGTREVSADGSVQTYPALTMHSVTEADLPNIAALFADPGAMKDYLDGTPKTDPGYVPGVYKMRWEGPLAQGLPWSVYPLHSAEAFITWNGKAVAPNTFLGFIGMIPHEDPGAAMFFALGYPDFLGNIGFAKHIAKFVLEDFVPAVVDAGFVIPGKDSAGNVTTEPFKQVVAFSPGDHPFYNDVLREYCASPVEGMYPLTASLKLLRLKYKILVADLLVQRDIKRAVSVAVGEGGSSS